MGMRAAVTVAVSTHHGRVSPVSDALEVTIHGKMNMGTNGSGRKTRTTPTVLKLIQAYTLLSGISLVSSGGCR
jgi:hypothetical protein